MSGPFHLNHGAVSFDVDGTLYSLDHFKVHVALRSTFDIGKWRAMERVRRGIRQNAERHDDLEAVIAERMGKELGISRDEAAAEARRLSDEEWPRLLRKITPFAELRPTLDALVAAGVTLIAASDYPPEAKLAALGLDDYPWRAKLGASDLGALKPRPEIYRAVVDAAGVPASSILHVGDSSHLDVAGAAAVGMDTVLVGRESGKPHEWHHEPTWAFPSVNKFCKAVRAALVARSTE